jgi:hypothetical protein
MWVLLPSNYLDVNPYPRSNCELTSSSFLFWGCSCCRTMVLPKLAVRVASSAANAATVAAGGSTCRRGRAQLDRRRSSVFRTIASSTTIDQRSSSQSMADVVTGRRWQTTTATATATILTSPPAAVRNDLRSQSILSLPLLELDGNYDEDDDGG